MLTDAKSQEVSRFISELTQLLDLGDRQIFFREGAYGRLFINFYNVPPPYRGDSAEGENNRLMLDIVGLQSADQKIRVELSVRGPAFGSDFKLRTKTTSRTGAARYIADFLNRAAQKKPYGFTFERNQSSELNPNRYLTRFQLERLLRESGSYSNADIARMTDDQLRRHVGHDRLVAAGDITRNGRREEPDEIAARELSLFIENDYDLVGSPNSQGKAIERNLLAKIRNGTFDFARSEQAWMYLMETGAKKYAKEFASHSEWSKIFNKPTRELVAHEFATTFAEENGALSKNSTGAGFAVEDGGGDLTHSNRTREEAIRIAKQEANRIGRRIWVVDLEGDTDPIAVHPDEV